MSASDLWRWPVPSLILLAIALVIGWRFRRYQKWNKEQQEFQFPMDRSMPRHVRVWVGIAFGLAIMAVLFPMLVDVWRASTGQRFLAPLSRMPALCYHLRLKSLLR